MTVEQIKNEVMFQTNNDTDDVGDFLPYLLDYINEGYDRLVYVWDKKHVGITYVDVMEYPTLITDNDVPLLPEWTHHGLVDWATWLVYRNGNPQKQQRGMAYRNAFEELLMKITAMGGKEGNDQAMATGDGSGVKYFFNIPD